jgi:hypothetical protein
MLGEVKDRLRDQLAEGSGHDQLRLPGPQPPKDVRSPECGWLEDRDRSLDGGAFHFWRPDFPSATRGAVGLGDDARDFEALDESV